jgi:hypothetical protein
MERLGKDSGPSVAVDMGKISITLEYLRGSKWDDRVVANILEHLREWRRHLTQERSRHLEDVIPMLISLFDDAIEPLQRRPPQPTSHRNRRKP